MSRLLDEALPLSAPERVRWLNLLPREHVALLPALQAALLGPSATDAGRLPPLMLHASGPAAGQRIGPYELLSPLGAGGMAEVWLANRVEGTFRREVALKLPRQSILSGELAQRFARECQILANLEHPLIARLYDAGIHAGNQPYLAMERVRGEPITDWCDARRLGLEARLQLYLQVLEAAAFAHERRVVHRDLKPSNIFVTDAGQVSLLDFGVAKLLEPDPAGGAAQLTSLYGQAITPDYASPELIRGEQVSIASDVYSLGVVLHELLTGVRPRTLDSLAAVAKWGSVDDAEDTLPPSHRIEPSAAERRASTPQALRRQLQGSLDEITLTALARQPADRYPSTLELGDDIRAFLRGGSVQSRPRRMVRSLPVLAPILAILFMAGFSAHRLYLGLHAEPAIEPVQIVRAQFDPPPHSVAVLPLVDIGGDAGQAFFADGLTEEIIHALSRLQGVQVAARTSSFFFKGRQDDLSAVAHRLNVASVLAGSIRHSGRRIRVTAELNDAVTGLQRWSRTYDRDMGDALDLQAEIAGEVARSLQVSLLGANQGRLALGGTRSLEAFDAYQHGIADYESNPSPEQIPAVIDEFTRALASDPEYSLAYAARSLARSAYAGTLEPSDQMKELYEHALEDARQSLMLTPDLAEAHLAMARQTESWTADFMQADREYSRARELAPGNARVQREYGYFAVDMGHTREGLDALRRAVALDPLNALNYEMLSGGLTAAHRYTEAIATMNRAISMGSDDVENRGLLGVNQYLVGDVEGARATCEGEPNMATRLCLALVYQRLDRQADARAQLAAMQSAWGDSLAIQYAAIWAQWGDTAQALDWLDRAVRVRDSGLVELRAYPLLDPLRSNPRFQALLAALRFPES